MNRVLSPTLAGLLLLAAGFAQERPATAPAPAPDAVLIPADSKLGFHFPYLLRVPPAGTTGAPAFLLVEPNNSGHVSPDFEEHIGAARALAKTGVGADVSRRLAVPFLMPVFPRSEELYTHSLNRPTLLSADPMLKRLDRQLLAMIADARRRLAEQGLRVNERVLMTGFSASGMFVTRFAALHPENVQALAVGGINGFVILPMGRLGDTPLPFPLGVADLIEVAGRSFDMDAWRRVAQFIFMGAKDTNDAVQFDDAYPPAERQVIYGKLGEKMLPDRWEQLRQRYREAGASATFRTYEGFGHGTSGRIHAEIADFFRKEAKP